MKPPPFELERPTTVADALTLLREQPHSAALAGGQSLMPALHLRERRCRVVIDLTQLDELRGVSAHGVLRVGAGEPMWDVEHHAMVAEHAPLLAAALRTVGAPSIRSRATLGGSAAWSEPTSQLPATMLALDATIVTTRRRLRADDFFRGPQQTALKRDELILSLEVPFCAGTTFGLHHVRRTAITWPVAGCAAVAALSDGIVSSARIALYGSGPRPVLATGAAELLVGSRPTAEAVAHAAEAAAHQATPGDDERASAGYRRRVLPVLVRRALSDAFGAV